MFKYWTIQKHDLSDQREEYQAELKTAAKLLRCQGSL